ncbi:TniQ family protein [Falsigemmobacter faecalis]|uniref:TniQ domain-containing protein n=1 Tax=Falsigemmobacter faecalis TaxID=2488730 RepID=A0A3P3DHT0_9RHOB|nr:TniQ family protein [Falsigemmobacter faecalis]RRH73811.1 hypothetical protein EG244_12115 [Falsigemmobacter faecalis]
MNSLPSYLPAPVERETLPSYVSRVAHSFGVSVNTFLNDAGLGRNFCARPERSAALEDFKQITGLRSEAVDMLLRWTGVGVDETHLVFADAVMNTRSLRNPVVRGCMACLRDDIMAGHLARPLTSAVYRGHWQLRDCFVCLRHSRLLDTLWSETMMTRRYDIGQNIAELLPGLWAAEPEKSEIIPTSFEHWQDSRLAGTSSDSWLDQQCLHATITLAPLFGADILALSLDAATSVEQMRLAQQVGYEVMTGGAAAISDALTDLALTKSSPAAAFKHLFRKLSWGQTPEAGYQPFRSILREICLKHWAYGEGEILLGEPVKQRIYHTLNSAAAEVGVSPRRMRIMLEASLFPPGDKRTVSIGRIFTPEEVRKAAAGAATLDGLDDYAENARQAQSLASARQGALTTTSRVRHFLGLSRDQFESVVASGLVTRHRRASEARACWRLQDWVELLETLHASAITCAVPSPDMMPLAYIAVRVQKAIGELLGAVVAGKIKIYIDQSSAAGGDGRGLETFRLCLPEAKAWALGADTAIDAAPPKLLSISQVAAKGLVPRGQGFPQLVRDGHTPSTRREIISGGRFAAWLSDEDVQAFKLKYVTVGEVSDLYGTNKRDVCAWLQQYGIVPFSPDGQDYGMIWLRSDLAALEKPGVLPHRRNQVSFFMRTSLASDYSSPVAIRGMSR